MVSTPVVVTASKIRRQSLRAVFLGGLPGKGTWLHSLFSGVRSQTHTPVSPHGVLYFHLHLASIIAFSSKPFWPTRWSGPPSSVPCRRRRARRLAIFRRFKQRQQSPANRNKRQRSQWIIGLWNVRRWGSNQVPYDPYSNNLLPPPPGLHTSLERLPSYQCVVFLRY